MTEQPNAYRRVVAAPNSRLAQLAAEYEQAKPAADAATARLKAITDAIKLELIHAAPGAAQIDLDGSVPLRLTGREEWRIDSKALKVADPETWVRYARKSTKWYLTGGRS